MASVEADLVASQQTSFSAFRNNPNKVLPIAVGSWNPECSTEALHSNQELFDTIKKIAKTLCPLMECVAVEDMSIRRLTGGLTNMLFLVTGHEKSQAVAGKKQACLVRVNGSADIDVFIDRDVENRIFAFVSSAGQAPQYFGRFLNGRVEEFYDDSVTVAPKDLGATKAQIENPDKPLCCAFYIARSFGLAAGAHALCRVHASHIVRFVQSLHPTTHVLCLRFFCLSSKVGALHSLRVKDGVCTTNAGHAEVS